MENKTTGHTVDGLMAGRFVIKTTSLNISIQPNLIDYITQLNDTTLIGGKVAETPFVTGVALSNFSTRILSG